MAGVAIYCGPTNSQNSGAAREVQELRSVLLHEDASPVHLDEESPEAQAIERLCEIGTPEAVRVLGDLLTAHWPLRDLKQPALLGLGSIGSEEAIKEIDRFESWATKRYADPPSLQFGAIDHAAAHFSDMDVEPFASYASEDGEGWVAFFLHVFDTSDLWLMHTPDEGQPYGDPILVDLDGFPAHWMDADSKLAPSDRGLVFTPAIELDINALTHDQDQDGLPSMLETRMGISTWQMDTDEDGVPDGEDSNPQTPKHEATDDVSQIRQAVFLAMFGTSNSRMAIYVIGDDGFTQQEYYGHLGPVLRREDLLEGAVNLRRIEVEEISATAATALIEDWEAGLAASDHEAKLVKKHGRWVVTEMQMLWIS